MCKTIVIGAQWGDEGKGKIVDWLAEKANVIVRFQGGHNAGHTIVVEGNEYKLSVLPSGILRKEKLCVIGNGVVLDPWVLLKEIDALKKLGINITKKNLIISSSITLILPIYSIIDNLRESQSGKKLIGTTGRGIGPAYEDKIARRSLRLYDLKDKKLVKDKVKHIVDHHNIWLKACNYSLVDSSEIIENILAISKQIIYFSDEVWDVLDKFNDQDSKILYEGAQGVMLDIDHGTYPFVTSSNTVAGQAFTGSGSSLQNVNKILGVIKAYSTRVGSGPFPTEDDGVNGKKLGDFGKEFGTVTGRKRRCGWLDFIQLKKAIKVSGITSLAITKLDVLDSFNEIKICVGYKLGNIKYTSFSMNLINKKNIKPIYKIFPGWLTTTYGITDYKLLPKNAQIFLEFIEKSLDCPIDLISTGPDRKNLIKIND